MDDHVFVDNLAYSLPGDRIRLLNKQLYLNGRKLDEPYVYHKYAGVDAYRDFFPGRPEGPPPPSGLDMLEHHVQNGEVVVPPGHYFALGDNRDDSADSRYWGFVPRENIVGKPLIVWWSYDAPGDRLKEPGISPGHAINVALHFFDKTRWDRTFRLVRGYPVRP